MDKERIAYEEATVAATIGGLSCTIAQFRRIFESFQNAKDWKAPCACEVDAMFAPVVMAAIEFYHGATPTISGPLPITGRVFIESKGYQG